MSFCKRIVATVVALSLMVAGAGCGESSSWAVKYQDYTLNSGIFIFYQTQAYSEATTILTEADKELDLKDTKLIKTMSVENTDITEWINDKATENMRIFLAVNEKFDTLGLELDAQAKSDIKEQNDSIWSYYSKMYEKNGIGKDTVKQIVEFDYKQRAVFNHYYNKGGEFEYSDEDILSYLEGNYSRVKYIKLNLKDGSSAELDDAGKKEIRKMADGYAERIKKGENIDDLIKEYNDYYDKLVSDAAAATATGDDAVMDEADLTAETVTEAPVTTVSSESVESSVSENSDAEQSVTEAAAESEAPATEPVSSDTEVGQAVTTAVSETSSSDVTTASVEINTEESTEETDPYANENMIFKGSEKDGYNPSKVINDAVFNDCTVNGDPVVVEDEENLAVYVIERYDVRERKDFLEDDARESLLWEILEEEFKDKALEWVPDDAIKKNSRSYRRYDPFDIDYS